VFVSLAIGARGLSTERARSVDALVVFALVDDGAHARRAAAARRRGGRRSV
jgi:hypothetical protein